MLHLGTKHMYTPKCGSHHLSSSLRVQNNYKCICDASIILDLIRYICRFIVFVIWFMKNGTNETHGVKRCDAHPHVNFPFAFFARSDEPIFI